MDAATINNTQIMAMASINRTIQQDNRFEVAIAVLRFSGYTIGAMAILLNTVSLIAMMFLKDKSTAYHRFLKNLSMGDLLGALSFLLMQTVPQSNSLTANYIVRSLPWMFFTTYILTLLCLSVIQYIAVCRPWKYSVMVTDKAVNLAIGGVWLISSLQLLIPVIIILTVSFRKDQMALFNFLLEISNIETLIWMGIFMLVALISTLFHVCIYCKIRGLKRRSTQSHDSENMRMKQRAFVTMAILMATGLLIRIPFLSLAVASSITMRDTSPSTRSLIFNILSFLLYLNFFTDPCIYGIKLREVRECYFELLSRFRVLMRCAPSRHNRERDYVVATSLYTAKTEEVSDDDQTSPC